MPHCIFQLPTNASLSFLAGSCRLRGLNLPFVTRKSVKICVLGRSWNSIGTSMTLIPGSIDSNGELETTQMLPLRIPTYRFATGLPLLVYDGYDRASQLVVQFSRDACLLTRRGFRQPVGLKQRGLGDPVVRDADPLVARPRKLE